MVDLHELPALLAVGPFMSSRSLQQLPDYTSPPLSIAIEAAPEKFRDDAYLDQIREVAVNGTCSLDNTGCQMLFPPTSEAVISGTAKLGVIIYGGGLVDPRSYSILAKELSEIYGLAVTIPIFPYDVAYLGCNGTDRIPLAAAAFPEVEKWVLAGHSMGGIGAQVDLWNIRNETSEQNLFVVGGLVLLGSYIRPDIGCGHINFSQTNIPMASAIGELDSIVNQTRFNAGQAYLPVNDTFHMEIMGGNHGYFGFYNDSLRTSILNQNDGEPVIPRNVQKDLTIGAIIHVASRMGLPLPSFSKATCDIHDSEDIDERASSASSPSIMWHSYGIILLALASTTSLFIFY